MTKLFWNVIKLAPVVVAATFITANGAFAAEANETSVAKLSESNNIGQVTSVSQFSDVQPTDWAFQALQSLVERYGCIAGYPDKTYRGNRALTRYEFAAGLNACLDRVNELIATATADLVKKDDLFTLQRLQEEFSTELATLRGRVDELDARTTELEAKQFSTTTKLVGEAIFSVSDTFGDRTAVGSRALVNGIEANYKFNPQVVLGGWVGYSNATAETNAVGASAAVLNAGNAVRKGDSADMFYWAANLTVKDFIKEGNLLALTFGQSPKVTSSDFRPTIGTFGRIEQKDSDTSYHLEALYRMQINNNITVAPALMVIFNPEHNDRNDTIYVGTLRTTFSF